MRPVLAAFVAVVATLAAPLDAEAKCMMPGPFVGPVSGSALPPSPTFWVFGRDSINRVEVWAGGTELSVATAVAWQTEDMVVLEVAVDYAGPDTLDVRVYDDRWGGTAEPTTTATYTIDPEWVQLATADRPVEIRGAEIESSRWTCSHTNAVTLSIDTEAPSYRFEWAPTRELWDAGERTAYTMPRSIRGYYRWATDREPPPPTLELGHVSCFGHTVPPEHAKGFDRLVYGGVIAQYADGTETPLPEPVLVPFDYAGDYSPEPFGEPGDVGDPWPMSPQWVEPMYDASAPADAPPARWPLWIGLVALGVIAVTLGVRRALVVRARGLS